MKAAYKDGREQAKTPANHSRTLPSLAVVDKPVSPILALTLIRQTAEGLAEASHSGRIHKNLRPETILIDANDLPLLLNFDSHDDDEKMIYASPEQKEGKVLDSRSNIYTLGIILYELLYGVHPDEKPAPAQELKPGENGRPEISPYTLRVIENCRKEQSWARYQNYTELLTAIDQALLAETTTAQTPTVPTAAPRHLADREKRVGKPPANTFSLNNRWLPIIATVLFLALLGLAMIFSWNQTDSSSAILIFDQLPLVLGGDNSPARQTAVSEGATATIRALQIRLPSRTPTPPPTLEASEPENGEEPPIAGMPTETVTPTTTATSTATSTNPPPPPPPPTETPTETAVPTPQPTPTATNTSPPPPPPPPPPTNTPQPSPTSAPTSTPEPTDSPPTPTPPQPTPTPPIIPTNTSPPTSIPPL